MSQRDGRHKVSNYGTMSKVPADGYVRVAQSPHGVCFMRAHWEGDPSEPMVYLDLRAGLPTWNREIVLAVKDCLSKCQVELGALFERERAGRPDGRATAQADVDFTGGIIKQDRELQDALDADRPPEELRVWKERSGRV